jgi:hypothetical protein
MDLEKKRRIKEFIISSSTIIKMRSPPTLAITKAIVVATPTTITTSCICAL